MEAQHALDTLGKRLKFAREQKMRAGLREMERSLKEGGLEANHVSIARYERDQRVPPADYVQAVARMAGLSAGWVLAGEGTPDRATPDAKEAAFNMIAAAVDAARAPTPRASEGLWEKAVEGYQRYLTWRSQQQQRVPGAGRGAG